MKLRHMGATLLASILLEVEINVSYLGNCYVWDPEYLVGLRFALSVAASWTGRVPAERATYQLWIPASSCRSCLWQLQKIESCPTDVRIGILWDWRHRDLLCIGFSIAASMAGHRN